MSELILSFENYKTLEELYKLQQHIGQKDS